MLHLGQCSGGVSLSRSRCPARTPAGRSSSSGVGVGGGGVGSVVGSGTPRRARCVSVLAQQGGGEDFGESVKRIAKKIQGSLPVIGLLSRLASPEGGFDEIAYPEFCRSVYDRATPQYFEAVTRMERRHGKPAAHRALLMSLWMATYGPGLVPAKDSVACARRARVSHDIEVEVDRFEGARNEALKKRYTMMAAPAPELDEQVATAVDGLAALALGIPDGAPIASQEDQEDIAAIVAFVFPKAGEAGARAAIEGRAGRTYA